MQLLYITHHSLLHLHVFSPVVSWILVIGATYGALRLVLDVTLRIGRLATTFHDLVDDAVSRRSGPSEQ